jgi:hypothetical protein
LFLISFISFIFWSNLKFGEFLEFFIPFLSPFPLFADGIKAKIVSQDSIAKQSSSKHSKSKTKDSGKTGSKTPAKPAPSPFAPPVSTRFVSSARSRAALEVQNKLAERERELGEVKAELKTLQAIQRRQDKALAQYERSDNDIPQLIARREEEIRSLTYQARAYKEKLQVAETDLKKAQKRVLELQDSNKELTALVESKNLTDRAVLEEKLRSLEQDIVSKDHKIARLQRTLEAETKTRIRSGKALLVAQREGAEAKDLVETLRATSSLSAPIIAPITRPPKAVAAIPPSPSPAPMKSPPKKHSEPKPPRDNSEEQRRDAEVRVQRHQEAVMQEALRLHQEMEAAAREQQRIKDLEREEEEQQVRELQRQKEEVEQQARERQRQREEEEEQNARELQRQKEEEEQKTREAQRQREAEEQRQREAQRVKEMEEQRLREQAERLAREAAIAEKEKAEREARLAIEQAREERRKKDLLLQKVVIFYVSSSIFYVLFLISFISCLNQTTWSLIFP